MILHNNNIADCFKNLICWINMFKRLLARFLLFKGKINFDSSLHDYVKRADMWKGNISKDDIRTIKIKSDIHLEHAFIILIGLEDKQKQITLMETQRCPISSIPKEQNEKDLIETTSPTSASTNSSAGKKQLKKRYLYE